MPYIPLPKCPRCCTGTLVLTDPLLPATRYRAVLLRCCNCSAQYYWGLREVVKDDRHAK